MRDLFNQTGKAHFGQALLEAQSLHISNIVEKMQGKSEACYKAVQPFLALLDVKQHLLRLFQE
jgi:hypothetical protein